MRVRVRTKLVLSFSILLILLGLTGYSGIKGTDSINNQNRIRDKITDVLMTVQDIQACSLRYGLYDDDQYVVAINTKADTVKSELQDVRKLMKSDKNRTAADAMIRSLQDYVDSNNEHYRLNLKNRDLSRELTDYSLTIKEDLKLFIDREETRFSRMEESRQRNRQTVQSLLELKEVVTDIHSIEISANLYKMSNGQKERSENQARWLSVVDAVYGELTSLKGRQADQEQSAYLDDITRKTSIYRLQVEEYTDSVIRQMALYPVIKAASVSLMESGNTVIGSVEDSINRITLTTLIVTLIILSVSILFGVIITITITRTLTRQLGGEPHEIEEIAGRVAGGDLLIDFRTGTLSGVYASMKDMTEQLTSIVQGITSVTDQVTSGSEHISTSSQEIAEGTNEQATSIEEISASVEELNANIQQNQENAALSRQKSRDVTSASEQGNAAVSATTKAIREIAEQVMFIQEIARNTNMLALNAAIEAARVGEAGKGFAVVAQEIRKLAESSRVAADSIIELSQGCVKQADDTQEQIESIVPTARMTSTLVDEIAAASEEQSRGAEQINSAVSQMDVVIQKNASASEELASMSEELHSQALAMKKSISYFRIRNSISPVKRVSDHSESPVQPILPREDSGDSRQVFLSPESEDDSQFEEF